eukprot:4526916-Karenia_brevis.AAC.1
MTDYKGKIILVRPNVTVKQEPTCDDSPNTLKRPRPSTTTEFAQDSNKRVLLDYNGKPIPRPT